MRKKCTFWGTSDITNIPLVCVLNWNQVVDCPDICGPEPCIVVSIAPVTLIRGKRK